MTKVNVYKITHNERELTILRKKKVIKQTKEMKQSEIKLKIVLNKDGKTYMYKKKFNIVKDRITKKIYLSN